MLEKRRVLRELHITLDEDCAVPIGHAVWSDRIIEDGNVIAETRHRDAIDLANLDAVVGAPENNVLVRDVLGQATVSAVDKSNQQAARIAQLETSLDDALSTATERANRIAELETALAAAGEQLSQQAARIAELEAQLAPTA